MLKSRARLAISLLVRACDILRDAVRRVLGLEIPPRCMVLYYHSVPAQHRNLFARQLNTILKLACPIATTPNLCLQPGLRYVAVTFDDGFVSVKENAAPELSKRQIPWTMFVPSGQLGEKPAWLKNAHPAAREDRVMTPEELRQLAADPQVTIGSHTVGHVNLLKLDPQQASSELAESKKTLETLLAKPVLQFSYPFGGRSPATDAQALKAGYTQIFCSEPTFATFPSVHLSGEGVPLAPPDSCRTAAPSTVLPSADPPSTLNPQPSTSPIGRASVDPDMSPLEFRLKLLGAYRWQALRSRVPFSS